DLGAVDAADADLEVQVRPRRHAGGARGTEDVADLDDVALLEPPRVVLHVRVDARDRLAVDDVVDHHHDAERSARVGRVRHHAVGDGLDLGAEAGVEVLPAVVARAAGAVAVPEAVADVHADL